mgnify:CR=1 FL=1
MRDKPIVLVTRTLPDLVEERLAQDYDVRLNPDDALYSPDELIELAQPMLSCHATQNILPAMWFNACRTV